MKAFLSLRHSLAVTATFLLFLSTAQAQHSLLPKAYKHFNPALCMLQLIKPQPQPSLNDIEQFHQFEASIKESNLEREYVIENILTNIIAKEHALLVGSPGIGKSRILYEIFSKIVDENGKPSMFSRLLTSETSYSDLLGPIDWHRLQDQNQYRRLSKESMLMSRFVFLDELFNIRKGALGHVLKALNERQIDEGGEIVKGIIETAVAATNGTNADLFLQFERDPSYSGNLETIKAVFDRFSSTIFIQKTLRPESYEAIIQGDLGSTSPNEINQISFDQIHALQKLASTVVIPSSVARLISYLGTTLERQYQQVEVQDRIDYLTARKAGREYLPYRATKTASPRTIGKAAHFLKAHIVYDWVKKRGSRPLVATIDDVQALKNFFCLVGPEEIDSTASSTSDLREAYHYRVLKIERPAFDKEFNDTKKSIADMREKLPGILNQKEATAIYEMATAQSPELSTEEALKLLLEVDNNIDKALDDSIDKARVELNKALIPASIINYDAYEQTLNAKYDVEQKIAELEKGNQSNLLSDFGKRVFEKVGFRILTDKKAKELAEAKEDVKEAQDKKQASEASQIDKIKNSIRAKLEAERKRNEAQKIVQKLENEKQTTQQILDKISNTSSRNSNQEFLASSISPTQLSAQADIRFLSNHNDSEIVTASVSLDGANLQLHHNPIISTKGNLKNLIALAARKALSIKEIPGNKIIALTEEQGLIFNSSGTDPRVFMLGPDPSHKYRATLSEKGDKIFVLDTDSMKILVLNSLSGQQLSEYDISSVSMGLLEDAASAVKSSQNNSFKREGSKETLFLVSKDESEIYFTTEKNDELFSLKLRGKGGHEISSIVSLQSENALYSFKPLHLDEANGIFYAYSIDGKNNTLLISEMNFNEPGKSQVHMIPLKALMMVLDVANISSAVVLTKEHFPDMLADMKGNIMALTSKDGLVFLVDMEENKVIAENPVGSLFSKANKNPIVFLKVIGHPKKDGIEYGLLVKSENKIQVRFPVSKP